MKLKNIIKRIIYPHGYSSEAYVKYLKKNGCTIGENVYFYAPMSNVIDYNNGLFIEIGNDVQITKDVKILAHDFSFSVLSNTFSTFWRKQRVTKIGNNVFIGQSSIILMGSNIGDNVIIGAGSVVTGSVEGNSVYAGNPAKKICSLESLRDKYKNDFIYSAQIYARQFKSKKGRYPEIKEMKIYQLLFSEVNAIQCIDEVYGKTSRIKASIKEKPIIDLDKKFNTVEELINFTEE
ncbi:MAG: Galactoside O-acetyltransferase [Firmicutes bacterium ADurb.Bin419]|nr:MAG: Galactoside O-acetyltransferase [Firmicutes bacterium ADurb.Bin419]